MILSVRAPPLFIPTAMEWRLLRPLSFYLLGNEDLPQHTVFVLIHSVSSWLTGKIEDLKDDLKQTERLNDLINKLLAEHTKISISRLADKDKYKEDWWISAPEALELGIIDEIIG